MDPVVLAAMIGAAPLGVGTFLNWRNSRKSRSILEGNGRGDVVKMLKTIQDTQVEQGKTLGHHGEALITLLAWKADTNKEAGT